MTASPYEARALLTAQPQLSYALFQAMLCMGLVDNNVLAVRRGFSRGLPGASRREAFLATFWASQLLTGSPSSPRFQKAFPTPAAAAAAPAPPAAAPTSYPAAAPGPGPYGGYTAAPPPPPLNAGYGTPPPQGPYPGQPLGGPAPYGRHMPPPTGPAAYERPAPPPAAQGYGGAPLAPAAPAAPMPAGATPDQAAVRHRVPGSSPPIRP